MLQNKIYLNFFIELSKTFLVILFGLSVIALTVRAVNFLDLIVDSGYSLSIYFKYSLLNLFGIAPKFIPLSFLLALTIFIVKHTQDSEFLILWTSGVKKIHLVNLFFFSSIITFFIYLIFSTLITPFTLNKSRLLLSQEQFSSFMPTIKTQQFNDLYSGFTFIVEKKNNNEIQNIFLHDKENNLKNFSSDVSKVKSTTIIASNGIVEKQKLFLFNGQIISTKKNKQTELIKFEQLSINLGDLNTSTIKKPKIQETSTLKLLKCIIFKNSLEEICNEETKKEIIPVLNRRITLPLYVPIISLICSLLLINSKKFYLSRPSIFLYSFLLLLFIELAVRYTGLSNATNVFFILFPIVLLLFLYFYLIGQFTKEIKSK